MTGKVDKTVAVTVMEAVEWGFNVTEKQILNWEMGWGKEHQIQIRRLLTVRGLVESLLWGLGKRTGYNTGIKI